MATVDWLSDTRVIVRPELPREPRYGVMFIHGNSQDERVPLTPEFFGQRRLIYWLADHGYVVMCDQHFGAFSWMNDDSIGAMETAYTVLQRQPGVKPGPVHVKAVSMGAPMGFVWARRHGLDRIASFSGFIPVSNVKWTYENTFLQSTIDAAYADQIRYYPDVDGLERDPMMFAADLVPIADRIKLWPSSGDTIAPAWAAQELGEAIGCEVEVVDGGEHSEEAVEAAPREDVIAWMRRWDFPPPARSVHTFTGPLSATVTGALPTLVTA